MAKVSDFIVHNRWHIPAELSLLFPNLLNLVQQVTIPVDLKEDIWLLCDKNWKPQCKVVIQFALVNIISTIWLLGIRLDLTTNTFIGKMLSP